MAMFSIVDITNDRTLEKALQTLHATMQPHQFIWYEALEVMSIIPYTDEARDRMGKALKFKDPMLFLAWIKYCSRGPTFKFSKMLSYYSDWLKFEAPSVSYETAVLQYAESLDADRYRAIMSPNISFFIDLILAKDKVIAYDLATVLHYCERSQCVCISLQPEIWHGSISTLRECLPRKIYLLFVQKLTRTMEVINFVDKFENEVQRSKVKKISTIMMDLKNKRVCDKIMSYVPELFFYPFFVDAETTPKTE